MTFVSLISQFYDRRFKGNVEEDKQKRFSSVLTFVSTTRKLHYILFLPSNIYKNVFLNNYFYFLSQTVEVIFQEEKFFDIFPTCI